MATLGPCHLPGWRHLILSLCPQPALPPRRPSVPVSTHFRVTLLASPPTFISFLNSAFPFGRPSALNTPNSGCLRGKTPALEQFSTQPFGGLLGAAGAAEHFTLQICAFQPQPGPQHRPQHRLLPSLPLPITDAPTISIHPKPQTLPRPLRASPPSPFSLLTPEHACLWVWFLSSIQNTPFQLICPFLQEALSHIPSPETGPDAPSLCSHPDGDPPLLLVPVARAPRRQTFSPWSQEAR